MLLHACKALTSQWDHLENLSCQQEMEKKENTTLFKRAKKPYQQDKQGYAEVLGLSLPEYICRASRLYRTKWPRLQLLQ